MIRLSYLVLSLALATSSFGQDNVVWPVPPLPPGTNSAATAMPRLDWFQRVQFNTAMAKKQPKVDLIFDGDSITDFWIKVGHNIWSQRYAKLNAFDFGISGDRTENLLWRLQNGQVDGLHPKLILLMIGTNNLALNTPDQIAEGVKADLDAYFKSCPDAVILLQAVFPRGEQPTDPNRAKIKAINENISKFDDGKKIIYVDFGDKFLSPDGTLSKDIMPDFLHPSEKGYQIWADAIQSEIDKFFPPGGP